MVPPPPPLNASLPQPPRRRNGMAQPLAVTTSLGGLSFQGLGVGFGSGYYSTPNSTSSLSGPFSQSNHSGHAQITGTSGRDTSPMALRHSSGHAAQYNPSEWRPVVGGSPQLGTGQVTQLQQTVNQGRASPRAYSDGESGSIWHVGAMNHCPIPVLLQGDHLIRPLERLFCSCRNEYYLGPYPRS